MMGAKPTLGSQQFSDLDCWPTREQQLLLRAGLMPADDAIGAWQKWRDNVDYAAADYASHRLLPLAYHNMAALGVKDPALERFKGVYRQNWLRNSLILSQIADICHLLNKANIEVMFLKGAPLALHYYATPALRPMDDVDALVKFEDAREALAILNQGGYRRRYRGEEHDSRIELSHSADLKKDDNHLVDLHWFAMRECCDPSAQVHFWKNRQALEYNGQEFFTPAANELLLIVLVHGSRWNLISPVRWVADAHVLIKSEEVDWEHFLLLAKELSLTVPVYATLKFYEQVIPGSIPGHVLADLAEYSVPVTEIREYRAIASKNNYYRRLLVHWYSYKRLCKQSASPSNLDFLSYLANRWGVSSRRKIPTFICKELVVRATRGRTAP